MNKFFLLLLALEPVAMAHERWVKHDLIEPINADLFSFQNPVFQSLLLRTLAFGFAILSAWLMRKKIASFVEKKWPFLKKPSNFIFRSRGLFNLKASKLIEDAALRLPALVLIYSAAGGFLIMPTFPVPEEYLNFARFAQALLAAMIVADLWLPVVGIGILLTIMIIFLNFGLAAIDVLPVVGVAYLYITTKVRHHHFLLKAKHIQMTRRIIGLSFFALGIMKILLPEIIVGVADNYSDVMNDPLIRPFWLGTDPEFRREYWALGFAFSEMLTGAFIAFGVFARTLALIGAFVFAKLMLSNFGWLEFPHIFPIACLLLVAFHPSQRQKSALNRKTAAPTENLTLPFRRISSR